MRVCRGNSVTSLALYRGWDFIGDDVPSFLHDISSPFSRVVRRLLLLSVVVRETTGLRERVDVVLIGMHLGLPLYFLHMFRSKILEALSVQVG